MKFLVSSRICQTLLKYFEILLLIRPHTGELNCLLVKQAKSNLGTEPSVLEYWSTTVMCVPMQTISRKKFTQKRLFQKSVKNSPAILAQQGKKKKSVQTNETAWIFLKDFFQIPGENICWKQQLEIVSWVFFHLAFCSHYLIKNSASELPYCSANLDAVTQLQWKRWEFLPVRLLWWQHHLGLKSGSCDF